MDYFHVKCGTHSIAGTAGNKTALLAACQFFDTDKTTKITMDQFGDALEVSATADASSFLAIGQNPSVKARYISTIAVAQLPMCSKRSALT